MGQTNEAPKWGIADLEIVFEDESLLVVNKPAGLPSQDTVDERRLSLYSLLQDSQRWPYLALHHRLDVPTSGLILFGKKKSANKAIGQLFQEKTLKKTYWAVTCGEPGSDTFYRDCFLRAVKSTGGKQLMRVVNSGGDPSRTDFSVLSRSAGHALVECRPQTGRMHQIRIHLQSLSLPIAGDALYGRVDRRFPRLQLHARCLEFAHPVTHRPLRLEASLPQDMKLVLERLHLQAPGFTES